METFAYVIYVTDARLTTLELRVLINYYGFQGRLGRRHYPRSEVVGGCGGCVPASPNGCIVVGFWFSSATVSNSSGLLDSILKFPRITEGTVLARTGFYVDL